MIITVQFSLINIHFLAVAFQVPVFRPPQPKQGVSPRCPLAIHSKNLEAYAATAAMNEF
jgi:hypothetical protein